MPEATKAISDPSIAKFLADHTVLYVLVSRRLAFGHTLLYGKHMTERLTRSDWINHGFRTLIQSGPSALKAGPMAESLKVSRGSFYWHFSSLADFHAQLLSTWQAMNTEQVIAHVEADAGPDRLKLLLRRVFTQPSRLDRAMRAWASVDKKVAAVVAASDTRRIAYIESLLVASGVDRTRAKARATFLFWAFLGQLSSNKALAPDMLDDIGELFGG
jgi:AcrR family transcriptional regulator